MIGEGNNDIEEQIFITKKKQVHLFAILNFHLLP